MVHKKHFSNKRYKQPSWLQKHTWLFRLQGAQRCHKKGKNITWIALRTNSEEIIIPIWKSEAKYFSHLIPILYPTSEHWPLHHAFHRAGLSASPTSLIIRFSLGCSWRHNDYFKQLYHHLSGSVFHLKLHIVTFPLEYLQVIWSTFFWLTPNKPFPLSQI